MTVEHVSIQLNPTIEKFEEELCDVLHEDRLSMQNKAMDGTSVSIVERRLLVSLTRNYSLTLCILMDFPIHIDTLSMGWSILCF